jgi:para-nitrobenzyl esterase
MTPQRIVNGKAPPSDSDRALSETIMSYWVNFATRANPNGPSLPHWPAFGQSGVVQQLGETIGPKNNDEQTARFEFINSYRTNGAFPSDWRRERY